MADKMVKVYGLRAPAISEEIRYVGITTQAFERRLSQHWHGARRGERTHKAAWMRMVQALGHSVEMVLLDEVPEAEWQEAERRYIAKFRNLTNSTAGGEGMLNPTPETRARMREAQLGKKAKPESVEKRRISMLGNKHGLGLKHSAEHIANAVAGRIGKVGVYERTEEYRAKQRAAKLGKKQSDETRRKRSDALRKRFQSDPSIIERIRLTHLGAKRSDATKEKQRQARLGKTASPEARARMSESAQRRWAAQRAANAMEERHG